LATHQLKWKPDEPAELRVLGNGAGALIPARILELAGKRMRLDAAAPVEGGAAVRLEWDGQLVLGQVLEVEPGGFWMEIHHMLLDTAGMDWQKQGWRE
jgi:hypothetical protein